MSIITEIKEKQSLQTTVAVVLILSAVVLFFHDLISGNVIATNDAGGNDLLNFYLPLRTLYAEALKNGELLFWTPAVYGGFPVFAEGQGGFLYPVNIIFCYLLSPVAAINVYILLHSFLMGLGIYLFVSKITSSKLLSIPSAVAAAVCGSVIAGHTRHLNLLASIVIAPWLFYSVELYLKSRKPSRALLFGALIGISILGGHPQLTFISVFFASVYLILRIVFDKWADESFLQRVFSLKLFHFIGIALIISVLIGLPQIKSTLELLPYTERSGDVVTQDFLSQGSLPFSGILNFVYPYISGNAGNNTFTGEKIFYFWEFFYYTGGLVSLLALLGVVKGWNRKEYSAAVRALSVLFILSYLLALGSNTQIYKVFSIFPFTSSFRIPARWFLGAELSILALSGFGALAIFNFVSGRLKNSAGKLPAYIISVVLAVAVIAEIYSVASKQVVTADAGLFLNPPSYVSKINDENRNSALNPGRKFTIGWVEFNNAVFKQSNGWEGKQDLFSLASKMLPPQMNAYYGVSGIDGYFVLVPNYIYEIWGDTKKAGIISSSMGLDKSKNVVVNNKFIKLTKLFGVKYLISCWPVASNYQPLWDSAGIKAYRSPDVMKKAWVVSKINSLTPGNVRSNAGYLTADGFDPDSAAYIEGSAVLPLGSENGSAEILKYENHELTIKANKPGFVVINDTWYPSWKAYIDGVEVPVYKTNIMMRGVIAPKAGTIIEMKFDKGYVPFLAILSYIIMLFAFAYPAIEKLRKK